MAVDIPCTDDAAPQLITLAGPELSIAVSPGTRWVDIEENGQPVTVLADGVRTQTLSQPLRFGWHALPVQQTLHATVRRTDVSPLQATIRIQAHCVASSALQAEIDWMALASRWADDSAHPLDDVGIATLLTRVSHLIQSAPNSKTRAFALHMRAQLFNANGRAAEAADAFEAAQKEWQSLGDPARAKAALAGRVGAWYRSGRYAVVVALTDDPEHLPRQPTYFDARLQNTRCLSLQALSELAQASRCYAWVLTQYKALGETAEGVATLQNYASLLRDSGKSDEAVHLGETALASVTGPDAAMVRGRIHVMLADLALHRGDINASLLQSDAALSAFAEATQDVRRWQANVYLQVASLFLQLGAPSEAYDAMGEAVKRISSRDAPARMAFAMQTFADIESSQNHVQSGLMWEQAAEHIYSRLNMPASVQSARLAQAKLQVQTGQLAEAERALEAMVPMASPLKSRAALIRADLAIRRDRLDDAMKARDAVSQEPLSLPEQVQWLRLRAQAQARGGDYEGAQTTLFEGAVRLCGIASQARSAVLRYLLEQQVGPLRRAGIGLVLEQAPAQRHTEESARQIWRWLTLQASNNQDRDYSHATQRAQTFDSSVADAFFKPDIGQKGAADATAQRALLSIVAGSPAEGPHGPAYPSSFPSIADLQNQLSTDTVVLAYAAGEDRGAVIRIDSEHVELVDAATPDALASSLSLARASLRSPSTPVLEIDQTLASLSTGLLGLLPATHPPAHLWILDDAQLAGVPWAAVKWPGQSQPLIDSTSVGLLHITYGVSPHETAVPRSLQVVVAAQDHSDGALQNLADASEEPTLITAAIKDSRIAVTTNKPSSRSSVLAALASTGSWVHVAAHGWAQPSRLGYAGIWLDADRSNADPGFLSWLEILEAGVRSDLVVLNACSLGSRGEISSNNNLSFASAVTRAGATNVVAALWSISDSATAVWVPAFYRAMISPETTDVPSALRLAQQALRQTRTFSHPFYWAGLQSESSLAVTVTAKP